MTGDCVGEAEFLGTGGNGRTFRQAQGLRKGESIDPSTGSGLGSRLRTFGKAQKGLLSWMALLATGLEESSPSSNILVMAGRRALAFL